MTEWLSLPASGPERATLVLAHGAGAAMDSIFMTRLCEYLAEAGISTLRFEFPYMARRRLEGGKRPPDRQPVLLQAWRDAYRDARANTSGNIPLLIGGKSMGGRMASLIAEELQPAGFVCLGYPFFPPGKRDSARTGHFGEISVPGLILQGTRDGFGKPGEVDSGPWPECIELVWLEEGDHDYKPRKKSGLTQDEVLSRAASHIAQFVSRLA